MDREIDREMINLKPYKIKLTYSTTITKGKSSIYVLFTL